MTTFRQIALLCTEADVALAEELLFVCDAQAVSLSDDGDTPILEPPVGTHPVWPQTRVLALFCDTRTDSEILDTLADAFQRAGCLIELPTELSILEDQDWIRISLDQFQPLHIGRFWIKPSWSDAPTPEGCTLVSLDPGLAFGTGMHPTTQLCLEWLSECPATHLSVLDFGAGSGILGVAAGCQGATSVHAIDIDPQALQATASNAALNHLTVTTSLPEGIPGGHFDVVLANILANPLIDLADTLTDLVKPGGTLVMAGLLDAQAQDVKAAYPEIQFASDLSKSGWTRLVGHRR